MKHLIALLYGMAILFAGITIVLLSFIAIAKFGAAILAIPLALVLAYFLGRTVMEIFGSQFR